MIGSLKSPEIKRAREGSSEFVKFKTSSTQIFSCLYRVRTGHGKPGKSWNLIISFSRPGKSWNLGLGHGKSGKISTHSMNERQ